MAIPKFLQDLAIISKLGDNPGSDNNLTTSGLRAKFDEAGIAIQSYINNTLIPALSSIANPENGLAMKADIAMGGHKVTGLGEPVAEGDAVPLGYANENFAPAGYGLGGAKRIAAADLDSTTAPGFYDIAETMTVNNITANYWYMIVSAYGSGAAHCSQELRPVGIAKCRLERTKNTGTWGDWGCDNPPLVLGVEYRTTKRYNDKPVYIKAINFGALPATASKNVGYYSAAPGATATSVRVLLSDGCVLTSGYNKDMSLSTVYGIWVDNTKYNVRIVTEADFSSVTAIAIVEYTKD